MYVREIQPEQKSPTDSLLYAIGELRSRPIVAGSARPSPVDWKLRFLRIYAFLVWATHYGFVYTAENVRCFSMNS